MNIALLQCYDLFALALFSASIIWWPIFGVLILATFFAVVNGEDAAFFLIVCIAALFLASGVAFQTNPFLWIWENLHLVLAALLQWAIIGSIWATLRWTMLMHDEANTLKKNEAEWFRVFNLGVSARDNKTFEQWLMDNGYISKLSSNKYRLFLWVFFWPFSVVNYFFSDFVRKVADALVAIFRVLFDAIRHRIYSVVGVDTALLKQTRQTETKDDRHTM